MEYLYSDHEVIDIAQKLLRFIVRSGHISRAARRMYGVDSLREAAERKKSGKELDEAHETSEVKFAREQKWLDILVQTCTEAELMCAERNRNPRPFSKFAAATGLEELHNPKINFARINLDAFAMARRLITEATVRIRKKAKEPDRSEGTESTWLFPPLSISKMAELLKWSPEKVKTHLAQYNLKRLPGGSTQDWTVDLGPPMPPEMRATLENKKRKTSESVKKIARK